ncbi:hypothetical protein BOTBODRAFT_271605 [Botryobasidium botryosum FD-172 SS1]|uniref:Uncharacterized protein n=1 Tax=Botryobasidium botryosum (strain FD-172 SS1) TaxID=930990 RepID=A0A067LSQ5_BOTB1|nr:hypothetical protein BOTBODRAFT_271605 [Botryobasidium botryosum FD-172 SS1]
MRSREEWITVIKGIQKSQAVAAAVSEPVSTLDAPPTRGEPHPLITSRPHPGHIQEPTVEPVELTRSSLAGPANRAGGSTPTSREGAHPAVKPAQSVNSQSPPPCTPPSDKAMGRGGTTSEADSGPPPSLVRADHLPPALATVTTSPGTQAVFGGSPLDLPLTGGTPASMLIQRAEADTPQLSGSVSLDR